MEARLLISAVPARTLSARLLLFIRSSSQDLRESQLSSSSGDLADGWMIDPLVCAFSIPEFLLSIRCVAEQVASKNFTSLPVGEGKLIEGVRSSIGVGLL